MFPSRLSASTALAAFTLVSLASAQNDECATATALTFGVTFPFDTTTATPSAPAWPCAAGTGGDLWFTFTAVTTGNLTVTTCGSGYDTALEAFTGPCANLISVGCNDDTCGLHSELVISAVAGTQYFVRVGGFQALAGAGIITAFDQGPGTVSFAVGTPPGATNLLTFDAPPVPSGPITSTSAVFQAAGIAEVRHVGTWNVGRDTLTAAQNVNGQGLVSRQNALGIAGAGQPLDNPRAGAGFDIRLTQPATAFGVRFIDELNFNYRVQLFLGSSFIGTEVFLYGNPNFPFPGHYWTTNLGAFDRIVITAAQLTPGWGIDDLAYVAAAGTVGAPYCTPNPNSTGNTGRITGSGSATVANNNLVLNADRMPNNAFGFFLTSTTQGTVANPGGSQGLLCLGGAIGRYVGPGQIRNTGATGAFSLALNLTQTPSPTGFVSVMPGQTRYFTAWHRDSVGGGATSNFTNGLAVTFQ